LNLSRPAFDAAPVSILEPATWRIAGAVAALAFGAALCIHFLVLQQFPNSGDEYAYLWQATAFAEGRITARSPQPEDAFRLNHVGDVGGRRFSKYPPGWPLLLTAGVRAGTPGLVNPLLAALALAGIYRLGCTWLGCRAALAGTLVTLVTPFFLLNAGSYHSHPSCLFAITALALCLTWAEERGGAGALLLAGASLGLAIVIRPYTALLFAVPLLAAFAPSVLLARGRRLNLLWFGLGGLPFALLLGAVNLAVTGAWWTLPWTQYDPTETLGFGAYGHSLLRGMKTTIRLCAEWVLYTSVVGAILLVFARDQRFSRRRLVWILLIAPVVGYMFWWSHGGNRYGPRFYFEGLLPFTLLAGAGFERAANSTRYRLAAAAIVVVSLGILAALSTAAHRQIDARRDVYRTVERAGLSRAVVLLTTASADMVRIDLTRNPPAAESAAVIYGLSRGDLDREVQAAYPDRTIYRYRWTPEGGTIWPAHIE
jgi:4-amino-4-deoxy-L-arabinose transferase-like glycosyltransferase